MKVSPASWSTLKDRVKNKDKRKCGLPREITHLGGKVGGLPSPGELPILQIPATSGRSCETSVGSYPREQQTQNFLTNQSEKQTLTLAEIKVHVMFVVSNLWISFEKQSAWKTDKQLGHKGTEKPGHIQLQKGCCPTDLEHPFGVSTS